MLNTKTIKLKAAQINEIPLTVQFSDLNETSVPEVRLVINSKSNQCSFSFDCVKVGESTDKWKAILPSTLQLESEAPFQLEVICDGFYSKVMEGILVTAPDVRPNVVATLEDSDVLGDFPPTNALLVPERPPKQSDIKQGDQGDVIRRDALVDKTRLSDIGVVTTPGMSDREPQAGAERPPEEPVDVTPIGSIPDEEFEEILSIADEIADETEDPFDAKRVAEHIIQQMVGVNVKTPTKGMLFKRDADGRPIVEGLDTPEIRAMKARNAEKVRSILSR